MFTYILLCLITFFTGVGLLKSMRLSLNHLQIFALAPVATLCFWTIVLGWGIQIGFRMQPINVVLWSMSLILAFIGIGTSIKTFKYLSSHWYYLLAAFILPILLMFPYFWHHLFHYLGSIFPDGWNYMSYGEYLLHYRRGTEGHLPLFYNFIAVLNSARFISSAFLAYFVPLAGFKGDTQLISNLFLAWIFFVLSSTCIFFSDTQNLGKLTIPYLILVILCGWNLLILKANNFDNALVLPMLPALVGISTSLKENKDNAISFFIFTAMLLASTLYIYVELAPYIFLMAGIFFLKFFLEQKNYKLKIKAAFVLILMLLMFIFLLPFISQVYIFFKQQLMLFFLQTKHHGIRPGEFIIPDLLKPQYLLPVFWGFFDHTYNSYLIATCFTVLALLGYIKLLKDKNWSFNLSAIIFLLPFFIMIFKFHYDYGAYKFLVLYWWAISFFVVVGAGYLLNKIEFHKFINLGLQCFLSFILISYVALDFPVKSQILNPPFLNINKARDLYSIRKIIGNSVVKVDVNNDFANIWAVYFLRDMPIKIVKYKLVMAAPMFSVLLQNSQKINENNIHFLLTDYPNTSLKLVWSNGMYYLWLL